MPDRSTDEAKAKSTDPPAPEVLKVQSDKSPDEVEQVVSAKKTPKSIRRRGTYRPSHKATFIGLAVVVGILLVNAGVIAFVMTRQDESEEQINRDAVTLSSETLDRLGVSRTPIGDAGTELTFGPDSTFNGDVKIGSDVSIAGQLNLNSRFTAAEASLANLEAGDTSINQLNVSGDGTVSNLSLRSDLVVAGVTRFQGAVTLSQLLTVNNNVNIAGNLSVGGTLSARGFQASSLVSDSTLTIGGHIITRGSVPGVSAGSAVGSNGTVSISGNDAAGTVAVNAGTGAGNGTLAYITFRQSYDAMPHIVITAVGKSAGSVYINRSANGFSISVGNSLSPGGYAFDYIVMQ